MRIGLFLGAGASAPFGMPTTSEFLNKLKKYGSYDDIDDEFLQSFLHYNEFSDIEYVLQALRDIKNFERSNGGDYFFKNLKHGMFSFEKKTLNTDQFINEITIAESELEKLIYENYRWKSAYRPQLVKIYDEIIGFLKMHSESIQIFTTNYDRAIEEYCNFREKYACIDGFERKPSHGDMFKWTGNFELPKESSNLEGVTLCKLHGSLNWKEHDPHGIIKTNEEAISADSNIKQNIVVMPTLSPKKEENVEPFRTISTRFVNFMENADACIVIGFSFRDQRINEVFKSFVDTGKTLVVLSPSSMKTVCKNLLKVEIPENYNKTNSLAPYQGYIWCISQKLEENTITSNLEIVLSLITAVKEKLQKQ